MVLATMGDERTEEQLARVLRSYEFGTPASRVTHLTELGYKVQFGPSTFGELEAHLDGGLFPCQRSSPGKQPVTLSRWLHGQSTWIRG